MVKGHCDEQFLKLKLILEKQLNSNYELGASVSVEWQGKEVVNLYGGFKDESKNCQWTEDTIVNVFSVTKAVSGICITKLIDDPILLTKKLINFRSITPDDGGSLEFISSFIKELGFQTEV